jgi:hypothetical protein
LFQNLSLLKQNVWICPTKFQRQNRTKKLDF